MNAICCQRYNIPRQNKLTRHSRTYTNKKKTFKTTNLIDCYRLVILIKEFKISGESAGVRADDIYGCKPRIPEFIGDYDILGCFQL
jgi:hypothetical protein